MIKTLKKIPYFSPEKLQKDDSIKNYANHFKNLFYYERNLVIDTSINKYKITF